MYTSCVSHTGVKCAKCLPFHRCYLGTMKMRMNPNRLNTSSSVLLKLTRKLILVRHHSYALSKWFLVLISS